MGSEYSGCPYRQQGASVRNAVTHRRPNEITEGTAGRGIRQALREDGTLLQQEEGRREAEEVAAEETRLCSQHLCSSTGDLIL